jgi:flagellar protein FliS
MATIQTHGSQAKQSALAQRYKMQEIVAATPEQLVLHIHDFAIQSCVQRDMDGVSKALVELIDTLNFDYQEISAGLFRLYVYMMYKVKAGNFEVPLDLFKKLRETWHQAILNRKAA